MLGSKYDAERRYLNGIDSKIIKYISKSKIIVCECVMIFINFVQNPVIFYHATFADIITSVTARCQGHIIRYEILIKIIISYLIIKTSENCIECYNQEMNGINSVIQWICIKTKIYL